jgi:hypothetical protein
MRIMMVGRTMHMGMRRSDRRGFGIWVIGVVVGI